MNRVPLIFLACLVALMASVELLPSGAFAADDQLVAHENGKFAALDRPDTLRTNLWLTEALMGEIVLSTLQVLPPSPARIIMAPSDNSVLNDLFQNVASDILMQHGYELYVDDPDTNLGISMDIYYGFDVRTADLLYPETNRTLGLWKNWIARELNVAVQVKVSLEETGQLLLSQRIGRRFSDRVDSGDIGAVESNLYDFTTAEITESGWHSRVEEIVVLGTLAGLIAIYFSNTAD